MTGARVAEVLQDSVLLLAFRQLGRLSQDASVAVSPEAFLSSTYHDAVGGRGPTRQTRILCCHERSLIGKSVVGNQTRGSVVTRGCTIHRFLTAQVDNYTRVR